MLIRHSLPGDLPVILQIYEHARAFMASHGNPNQWGKTTPAPSLIEQDIADGTSYVCEEDGRVVAVFFFKEGEDPTYREICGQWLDDSPYSVVHRIASDGTVKGAGTFCLLWALERCRNLRIDTHRDNYVMQNMLAKNGFTQCGIIRIADGSERLAYQRIL